MRRSLAIRRVMDRYHSVTGQWECEHVFYGLGRAIAVVQLAAALGEAFRDSQTEPADTSGDVLALLEVYELVGARE